MPVCPVRSLCKDGGLLKSYCSHQLICGLSVDLWIKPASLCLAIQTARRPYKVSTQAFTVNLGWHTPPTKCVLQEERSQVLWQALERIIPDIRARAELVLTGSPLTHEFWLNRHKGTYGPAISAAGGAFPGPSTPVKGLYRYSQCLYFPCQPCVVSLRGCHL